MKKAASMSVVSLLLIALLLLLFINDNQEKALSLNVTVDSTSIVSQQNLENLKTYWERFELNRHHLEQAVASIYQIRNIKDTLCAPLTDEWACELKILHQRCYVHITEIKKSISNFHEYPNDNEQERLCEASRLLTRVDQKLDGDSLKHKDIYNAFDHASLTLAKAEVNLSKAAIRTGQRELAEMTLRQAKIYLKNALLLDYLSASLNHRLLESEVYGELDSLLSNDQLTEEELTQKQFHISEALDELLQQKHTFD